VAKDKSSAAEGEQRKKIEKFSSKFGGSLDDVWAIGQPGSGFVRFDGDFVHIQHSGALSRLTVGKSAKRIPVHSISALHLKPAGAVVSGYLQFTMAGAVEKRGQFGRQSFDAAGDENSIMFTKAEQPFFERFRDAVEEAISERHRPAAAAPTPAPDLMAQLKGLSELRDAGVISEDEFAAKKAEILSRM
jgi:hypothetical protein